MMPAMPESISVRSATSVTRTTLAERLADRQSRPGRRLPRAAVQRARQAGGRDGRAGCSARHLRQRADRPRRSPKPTLADAGSPARSRYPGRAALDPSVGLDDAGWERFADGLARAVGALPRTRLRAHLPPPHSDLHRGPVGDRAAARDAATSGYASTPVTCCWDVATRSWRFANGPSGSIRSTSRTRAWPGSRRSSPRPRRWRRSGAGGRSAPWATAISTSTGCSRRWREIGYTGWLVVEQDVLPDPANPQQPAERPAPQPRVPARAWALSRSAWRWSAPGGWAASTSRRSRPLERSNWRASSSRSTRPGRGWPRPRVPTYASVDELLARRAARRRC